MDFSSVSPTCALTEVADDLSHLLPQSEALQGDILTNQCSGFWELDFEVSRVFPDGTCDEWQDRIMTFNAQSWKYKLPYLQGNKIT